MEVSIYYDFRFSVFDFRSRHSQNWYLMLLVSDIMFIGGGRNADFKVHYF
jgi:hypothetical protein